MPAERNQNHIFSLPLVSGLRLPQTHLQALQNQLVHRAGVCSSSCFMSQPGKVKEQLRHFTPVLMAAAELFDLGRSATHLAPSLPLCRKALFDALQMAMVARCRGTSPAVREHVAAYLHARVNKGLARVACQRMG